ncbi:DUF3040 domain-containing protein [Streptomyces sp. R302]|uniref:DUF3040 domain-containing protein n=1 Tax=unclassified Streptomyces TaxID=2593676 RepID=UPI00145D2773|nr:MULTISPECIES: DUF3040 domain-containing protein [unclassified Streptomyces]NML51586.1 DUF3040 domain-containing protein [Streptomyces sp. R301]NML80164.1 DUF3040 domain-containing protein [Streptomyces sp. R302]
MSHFPDDRRSLAAIERDLSRDDPDLVARMDTLNQRLAEQQGARLAEPTPRRDRRVVLAVVLGAVALLALLLTAVLGSSSSRGGDEPGGRPAAVSTTSSRARVMPAGF